MADTEIYETKTGVPGWVAGVLALVAILSIAGLGMAWYDSSQLQAAQQSMNNQIKADQQTTAQQISAVEQKEAQSEAANTELQSDLGVVTKKLRVTQGDLQKARQEATQIRDDSAQKIADLNTDVTTKLATKASTDDLQATNGTVTGVKTDLEGTKNDLKMARSELGTLDRAQRQRNRPTAPNGRARLHGVQHHLTQQASEGWQHDRRTALS